MAFRRRNVAVILLALAALAIGIAWSMRSVRNEGPVTMATEPAAVTVEAAAQVAPEPTQPVRAPTTTPIDVTGGANARGLEPIPEGNIGDTYAVLVALAEAGNGAAAAQLADLMRLCGAYQPKSREAAEKELVDGLARFDAPRTEADAITQDTLVAMVVGVQDRQQAACPGFAALGIADPVAEQRRWIETAVRLGDARSMVELADMTIAKYREPGEIVEHAEELRVLRPQAMALLQRAVMLGEPAALLRMSAAHRTGDLADIDPVDAYAWMLAYRAGPPVQDVPAIATERVLQRLEAPLDAAQRAEAQRRAAAIRARCCAGG